MKNKVIAAMIVCFGVFLMSSCTETPVDSYNYDADISADEYVVNQHYEDETKEYSQEENVQEEAYIPVEIYADFDVVANPDGSFVIETNLPDETELGITLDGKGYLAQGKAYVKDGKAVTDRFTNNGEQLVGDYTLEVIMPIVSVQSDNVKKIIGNNGEYLTGPYVEEALGSVIVSKEFEVSFKSAFAENENIIDTDENSLPDAVNTPEEAEETTSVTKESTSAVKETETKTDNTPVKGVYYRTPTGKKYHADPDCGGKNSYVASSISDLGPCKKCVL